MPEQKTIVLGVTGSISAYKSAELVSCLKKEGFDVCVILTPAGAEFITPLTLETLSKAPVSMDPFTRKRPHEVEHIALAKRADALVVAPATADFIARAAQGMADDLLTSVLLATRAPVLIAPAMNANMLEHPATQANIALLQSRGCRFVEPEAGLLACGDVGRGRLASTAELMAAIREALAQKRDLSGKRILITAGPTIEDIDPVRYLTNRSSGRMGFALAEAARKRGAQVRLIAGPVALATPPGVIRQDIRSSAELFAAVDAGFEDADALIMAAAPADFTPAAQAAQKIKKTGDSMTLTLKPTEDILRAMGEKKGERLLMGFAAETDALRENALSKLARKNLDFIAANDVTAPGAGFQVPTNAVTLYRRDGTSAESGLRSKAEIADWLLDALSEAFEAQA